MWKATLIRVYVKISVSTFLKQTPDIEYTYISSYIANKFIVNSLTAFDGYIPSLNAILPKHQPSRSPLIW